MLFVDTIETEELERMLSDELERAERMGVGFYPPDMLSPRQRREHRRQTARIMLLERRLRRRLEKPDWLPLAS